MIDLVIAGTACDTIFPVNLPFHFRWNVPHLFGVSGYTEILNRDCERVSGRQLWIGKNWRGLLGKGYRGQNSKKAMARMNI